MNREEKIKRITDFIKSGEKSKDEYTIGMEMEHFIVDKDSLKTVTYFDDNGVRKILEDLSEKDGYSKVGEGEYILALEKDNIDITLEPGSQFEIAIKSSPCIKTLEKTYKEFMKDIIDYLDNRNEKLVTVGYHPNTKIEEIKILPKERYGFMFDYFKTKGSMAHNMMKGTASLQVTIDYSNEEDFKKKYYIGNVLAPILYGLFDNSYIFEKEPSEDYTIRQKIWENTDKERSGLFKIAFDKDISYKKYAEQILDTPPIFLADSENCVYTKEKTLEQIADEEELNKDLIFHAMSIVFPDIRVKTYIEIRIFDEVPYPLNFAAVALIKGLFYNENNLNKLYEIYGNISYEEALEGKNEVQKYGINAKYLGNTILEHGKILAKLAKDGLEEGEKAYIIPLEKMLEEGKTCRDIFKEIYEKEGLAKAVDMMSLTREKLNV